MTLIPGKLTLDRVTGKIGGPVSIQYNSPDFPCVNGSWGSGAMQGVLEHTNGKGDFDACVNWFNNPAARASAQFEVRRDGLVHQFGPIGLGWIAWHAEAANLTWYGIENEDDGNPDTPLADAQIASNAQLVEFLSSFAGFPLRVTDRPAGRGFGTHSMGGAAWGGHTCPDLPPAHVRSAQRQAIVDLAKEIRHGGPPPPEPEALLVLPNLSSRKVLSADGGKHWA